jgi:hypothetical protein
MHNTKLQHGDKNVLFYFNHMLQNIIHIHLSYFNKTLFFGILKFIIPFLFPLSMNYFNTNVF